MTPPVTASGCPPMGTRPGGVAPGWRRTAMLLVCCGAGLRLPWRPRAVGTSWAGLCCYWAPCPDAPSCGPIVTFPSFSSRSFVARYGVLFETARGPEMEWRPGTFEFDPATGRFDRGEMVPLATTRAARAREAVQASAARRLPSAPRARCHAGFAAPSGARFACRQGIWRGHVPGPVLAPAAFPNRSDAPRWSPPSRRPWA